MIERILDLSDRPVRLRVRDGGLVIQPEDEAELRLPLPEVAVLVLAHPQITLTQAVLSGVSAAGGVVVTCDERRLPIGMLLPLQAHFVQAERFARQAAASLPTRKRLWQQVVRAKIRAQARVLLDVKGEDAGIRELVPRVRSGDPTNVEAQAARRYWPALFGPEFRRDPDGSGLNAPLNYGYGVLRAQVARALCAAGLHPSLGLHHHNRYNAFCLADDLMEPFRPVVDQVVAREARARGAETLERMERDTRQALLEALLGRVSLAGERRTLFDASARVAASLAAVFAGEREQLLLPEA